MPSEIDSLAFELSDIFSGYHKAVLHFENPNSFRVAEWRRVAQFILDHPAELPKGKDAVDETAIKLAKIFLGSIAMTEGYWRRTKDPWRNVAVRALQMQPN